ncbi:MAG TPA: hypothetical protein VF433_07270 [Cellvibrio sp.]|uniref:Uncharacterized protein n=1 Tax=Oxalicibacterium faecigallinarum TaxID=573741 RepID=A0A8J3AK18_9BURK|nr:hypothetical protein [Oxalicibacterium faecigallinarum]GGI15898.1 hypothetical protein GCM10008066_01260 [Oxalicibacterium faecigallinarum]
MNDQDDDKPIPAPILIVGLVLVLGCMIWCGLMFFVYGGSIIYGVIGGVCLGASYSFGKQIWAQFVAQKR